jgi:hypothetical protein
VNTTTLACAALAALLLLPACDHGSGDHGNAADSIILESANLFSNARGGCDVRGTIFNTNDQDFCDVLLEFRASDRQGFQFADAFDNEDQLPPNSRGSYSATFFDENGDQPPCDFIDSFDLADLQAFCGS